MIVYSVSTYQVLLVMVQLWRLLTEEYLCFREVIKLENSLDILFFLGGHLEAVEKGRDPIPSKVHLHAHTHDHDGEFMMENLLLMSMPELSMKDMKKYYGKNHRLNLILIKVKHITKLLEEQRRDEV